MSLIFHSIVAALGLTVASSQSMVGIDGNPGGSLENTVYMDVAYGRVVIELRPDLAPNHVERVKQLVRAGFYNGNKFYRVIDGFMVQSGDPTGTGLGGSGVRLPEEFSSRKFERGVVGMARGPDPDSADSQFFIMTRNAPHLDGQYTIFGEVIAGMEFIDMIRKGDMNRNGFVANPDVIRQISIASDVH